MGDLSVRHRSGFVMKRQRHAFGNREIAAPLAGGPARS
jgi:hypothetical protein